MDRVGPPEARPRGVEPGWVSEKRPAHFPNDTGVARSGVSMAPTRHILLVEDDRAIREAVTEILEFEGFAVTCAKNGADALAQLDQTGQRPQLILLDLTMPVMDGWTFREVQSGRPDLAAIPVVVLSAIASQDARALERPVAAMLSKPFELQRLLEAVERYCLVA